MSSRNILLSALVLHFSDQSNICFYTIYAYNIFGNSYLNVIEIQHFLYKFFKLYTKKPKMLTGSNN